MKSQGIRDFAANISGLRRIAKDRKCWHKIVEEKLFGWWP